MLKGAVFAFVLAVGCASWTGTDTHSIVHASKTGAARLSEALLVLVCAWGIGSAIEELQAAEYLVSVLDNAIAPAWYPALIFILAAIVAFSTGTSFGTMGTLMPLAIPFVHQSRRRHGNHTRRLSRSAQRSHGGTTVPPFPTPPCCPVQAPIATTSHM